MPKYVDVEEKKLKIMRNALRVFIEKGYHSTTMENIANNSGMARTTMYEYFANKDEIFKFALEHAMELLNIDLEHIIGNDKLSSWEKIMEVVRHVGDEYAKHLDIVIILVELWLLIKRKDVAPTKETVSENLINAFKTIIIEGINRKEIREEIDPEITAKILYSLTQSLILQISLHNDTDFDEYLQGLNVLLKGLKQNL